jgi:hypothetical protein
MNVAKSRIAARKAAARKTAIRRTSAARSRNAQNVQSAQVALIARLQKAQTNMFKDIAPAISFLIFDYDPQDSHVLWI